MTIIVSITVDVDTKRSWTRTAGIKLTNAALLTKVGRGVTDPSFCVIYSGDTRVSSTVATLECHLACFCGVCHLACVSLGVREVVSSSLCPSESFCVIYSGDTKRYL